MESRQILRAISFFALILLLTVDYTLLISQVYQTVLRNDSKNERGDNKVKLKSHKLNIIAPRTPGFTEDRTLTNLEANIDELEFKKIGSHTSRLKLLTTIKDSCLPKLICELNATTKKDKITESEKSLLYLIRDTSIGTTAEVTSKYHFATHMGQLISGIDGTGCHNFFPTCPFPSLQVLDIMKKVRTQ